LLNAQTVLEACVRGDGTVAELSLTNYLRWTAVSSKQ
jgi:hypothetical protein